MRNLLGTFLGRKTSLTDTLSVLREYLNILRIPPEFSAVQCISFFRFGRVSYYAFHTYHTDITMKVIASVEKYENAGMKFSTVPAIALAESRASDACCLFLTVHTLARSQRVFLPRKVPSKS